MIEPYKSKTLIGIKKSLGQLKKALSMVEDNKYCMDIIQQLRAVEGLLRSSSTHVLESHLHTCASKAFTSTNHNDRKKLISELVATFKVIKK